jgi:hypothetical protein
LAYVSNFNQSQLSNETNTIHQRFSQATPQQRQLVSPTRNTINGSNPPNPSPDPLWIIKRDVAILVATSNYVFGVPALAQSTTTSGNPTTPISPALAVSLYKQAMGYVSNFNDGQLSNEMNTINQRFFKATPQQQQLGLSSRATIHGSNPPTPSPDLLTSMRRDVAINVATSNYVFGVPALAQGGITSGNPTTTARDIKTLLPQALTKALTMSPQAIQIEMHALGSIYNKATPAQMAQMGTVMGQVAPFTNFTQSKVVSNIVFGTPI